jgi:hypothetical protein
MNKTYFTLNHRVVFYTPSTDNTNKPITREAHFTRTSEVADSFTNWFGGATIERVQGYYKSKDGKIVVEAINKVISFTTDATLENKTAEVLQLATDKKILWGQESIGIEIDTRMLFVD